MKQPRRFFALSEDEKRATLEIYGSIGRDWFDEYAKSAADFRQELKELDVETIEVRMHSDGGEILDGLAMHNMLVEHPARVEVYVDGLVASMATVVASAGDFISMPENGFWMVHEPWGLVIGTADEMRTNAALLDSLEGSVLKAYARHSSLPEEEIRALMDKETWMTAAEALDAGFVHEVRGRVEAAASIDVSRFKRTPSSAVALSRKESPMKEDIKNPTAVKAAVDDTKAEPEGGLFERFLASLGWKPPNGDAVKGPIVDAHDPQAETLRMRELRCEVREDMLRHRASLPPSVLRDEEFIDQLVELKAHGFEKQYASLLDSRQTTGLDELLGGEIAGENEGDYAHKGIRGGLTPRDVSMLARRGLTAERIVELQTKYASSVTDSEGGIN